MKKIILAFMAVLLIGTSMTSYAIDSTVGVESRYEDFVTFKELVEAYDEAILNEDIEEQARLEKIAERTLREDIEEVERIRKSNAQFSLFNYSTYIDWSEWIDRDGMVSLSIQPNRGRFEYWSGTDKANAWDVIVDRHSSDSKWRNRDSMEYQFMCHARYLWSIAKQPWNIEPHKRIDDINSITCN